jgi:hypothetical protein
MIDTPKDGDDVLSCLTDREVYLWWARHNTGKKTAERELARRMLQRGVRVMEDDLFMAGLRQVPGSSRSEIIVVPKER